MPVFNQKKAPILYMSKTATTITEVKVWKENLELARPYSIAYKTIDSVENVFISLRTDRGLVGMGAASPAPFVTGEEVEDTLRILQQVGEENIKGQDLRHFHRALHRTAAAMVSFPAANAALDIALHDLFANYLEVPLAHYLGQVHTSLPTSITIGIQDLKGTLEDAREFVGKGFKIIKLKIGKSLEEDVETFRKLRGEVGPEILIRVDANQGYGPDELKAFAKATLHHQVEFYEQPFPPDEIEHMKMLPLELRNLSAADEDLISVTNAIDLAIPERPYGIFNIKLMKCGGIQPALHIAEIARRRQIDLMWGCNDESLISITAALHAALACPSTRYLDLDGSLDLARDVAKGGFVLKDGYLSVSDRPGLGVTIVD